MESVRQNKISRLIQKTMGEILQSEFSGIAPGTMITVTQVRVTSDLSLARVFFSIFGKTEKKAVFETLNNHKRDFRRSLGNRLRLQLRSIPELDFFVDDSLDFIDRIDELLKQ